MNLQSRIEAFTFLGKKIEHLLEGNPEDFRKVIQQSIRLNAWFTEESIWFSLHQINRLLSPSKLQSWTSAYSISDDFSCQRVAVILPGNIPLVGFHDVLCVLISGKKAILKPSSKDTYLLPYLLQVLTKTYPEFSSQISYTERELGKDFDAVIATGSNNSLPYFESYFNHLPHIFRKNRTSVAVLNGEETAKDLANLGRDIFMYFGLGCRNVSKLLVPADYNLSKLTQAWVAYKNIIHHKKYANNYAYQKIFFSMNNIQHFDKGFIILKESAELFSPLAVLHYERYSAIKEVENFIQKETENIQCIVGKGYIPFGESQKPSLEDYADGINTMRFLTNLKVEKC